MNTLYVILLTLHTYTGTQIKRRTTKSNEHSTEMYEKKNLFFRIFSAFSSSVPSQSTEFDAFMIYHIKRNLIFNLFSLDRKPSYKHVNKHKTGAKEKGMR